MKTMYQYGTLAAALLLIPSFALAKLSDSSKDAVRDRSAIEGSTVSTEQKSSCYNVIHIDGNGGHVSEYVDPVADKVFMVVGVSRMRMSIAPFLNDSDFNEIKTAQKTVHAPPSKSHNHQAINAETANLKLHVKHDNNVQRTVLIKKAAVPSCALNLRL